jgi:hypothetical protein
MFILKMRAAGLHFAISAVIASLVLTLVYFGWYRSVLSTTEAVGTILLIMVAIDIVLGPLMTMVVYKPNKKSLKFDLTVIALIQLGFLAYGVYTVHLARPAYLVFVKDRFEAVAVTDWPETAQQALENKPNPATERAFFGPVFVGAKSPEDANSKQELLFSAAGGGADIGQMPQYYVPFEAQRLTVAANARPIAELKDTNKKDAAQVATIDSTVEKLAKQSGVKPENIGYLPLKGKQADGVVLVDKAKATVLGMYLFKPWP